MPMLDSCVSSGKQTSSVAISTKPCLVYKVVLINGGAACDAKILNGGSGGTEVGNCSDGGSTAKNMSQLDFALPLVCSSGVYLTLSGASAYAYVYYQQYGTL